MIQAIYYSINETGARAAHEMMSMSDYQSGSKTDEYKAMVNKAYDLGNAVIQKRPSEAERVEGLCEWYSRRLARNFNNDIRIGMMCPSVLISGAGNFPTKKKEKQLSAWDRNHEDYLQVEKILEKITSILYGNEVIKSNDENAIEKLQEKLDRLKDKQEMMKAANKAIRNKDVDKGNEMLRDMGFTESQIKTLREPDYCGRVGFPAYELQNNNANIHRIENRIESLQATKEAGTKEVEHDSFKVVENADTMRLQLIFDGKPTKDVRDILKHNGFRWAPSQSAWQRQLTGNAKYALERVMEQLNNMEDIIE